MPTGTNTCKICKIVKSKMIKTICCDEVLLSETLRAALGF